MCSSFTQSLFVDSSTSLKCLTAGCSVSHCFVNYTNDKAIPVAKFVASCKFEFLSQVCF
jgi:hypothetical protein